MDKIEYGDAGPRIERTHHLDLDFRADRNRQARELAEMIAAGLLVTWELIVPARVDGVKINEFATVRFFGPRSQLEKIVKAVEDSPGGGGDPVDDPNVVAVDTNEFVRQVRGANG